MTYRETLAVPGGPAIKVRSSLAVGGPGGRNAQHAEQVNSQCHVSVSARAYGPTATQGTSLLAGRVQ